MAEDSYGRQLGRIMDAQRVLVKLQQKEERLDDSALKAFLELAEEIKRIRQKSRPTGSKTSRLCRNH